MWDIMILIEMECTLSRPSELQLTKTNKSKGAESSSPDLKCFVPPVCKYREMQPIGFMSCQFSECQINNSLH